MKLTYIFHSGYAIEGDNFTIIIDYYKDSSDIPGEGIVYKELLKKRKSYISFALIRTTTTSTKRY